MDGETVLQAQVIREKQNTWSNFDRGGPQHGNSGRKSRCIRVWRSEDFKISSVEDDVARLNLTLVIQGELASLIDSDTTLENHFSLVADDPGFGMID